MNVAFTLITVASDKNKSERTSRHFESKKMSWHERNGKKWVVAKRGRGDGTWRGNGQMRKLSSSGRLERMYRKQAHSMFLALFFYWKIFFEIFRFETLFQASTLREVKLDFSKVISYLSSDFIVSQIHNRIRTYFCSWFTSKLASKLSLLSIKFLRWFLLLTGKISLEKEKPAGFDSG